MTEMKTFNVDRRPFSAVAAVLAIAWALSAAPLAAQEGDTVKLGTVVVTASKTPAPAGTLTQAVTVITGEDLRARGVMRVSDALREVPGASMVQTGSFGSVATLFLRGGESRYTKVLIDGVPVNSSGGFFDFSHLTTDNIERIEVVRGPSSVLHGADAVTGTVQIFTKRGAGAPGLSLMARGGTHRTLDASAEASASSNRAGFSFGAGHHSTDGILPFNNQYQNGTLSAAVKLRSTGGSDANISARYSTAEFHYPTDFIGQPVDSNAYRVQHRLTVGVDAGRNIGSSATIRLLAGNNDVADLTEDISVPFGGTAPRYSAFRSRGYRRNIEGRMSLFAPGQATLTAGVAYEWEHENSSSEAGDVGTPAMQTDSFDASRRNVAYYTELLGSITSRFSYTISGRVDHNSDYDRFSTFRVGANTALIGPVRLRASVSTAFNAPAFNQLRPTLFTVGSPNLRPESIRSAEVGVLASFGEDVVRIEGNYFRQRFDQLIQFVSGGPPDFLGSYANLTAASANGYEAELHVRPSIRWRGSASYTVVTPRVVSVPTGYTGSDRPGDALIRRPSHSGSFVTTFTNASGLSMGGTLSYVGERPDLDFAQFPSPRVTLPAYAKVDVSGEYPLGSIARTRLTISARVENLFDREYEDVLYFRAPGRVVLIGARALVL
jgi:vitamin B12 transporter